MKVLIADSINKTQEIILKEIMNLERGLTITALVRKVSKRYKIAESTLRWNIEKLKSLGLLTCGTSEKRGVPVKLNGSGSLLLEILRGRSSAGERSTEDAVVVRSNRTGPAKKRGDENG